MDQIEETAQAINNQEWGDWTVPDNEQTEKRLEVLERKAQCTEATLNQRRSQDRAKDETRKPVPDYKVIQNVSP